MKPTTQTSADRPALSLVPSQTAVATVVRQARLTKSHDFDANEEEVAMRAALEGCKNTIPQIGAIADRPVFSVAACLAPFKSSVERGETPAELAGAINHLSAELDGRLSHYRNATIDPVQHAIAIDQTLKNTAIQHGLLSADLAFQAVVERIEGMSNLASAGEPSPESLDALLESAAAADHELKSIAGPNPGALSRFFGSPAFFLSAAAGAVGAVTALLLLEGQPLAVLGAGVVAFVVTFLLSTGSSPAAQPSEAAVQLLNHSLPAIEPQLDLYFGRKFECEAGRLENRYGSALGAALRSTDSFHAFADRPAIKVLERLSAVEIPEPGQPDHFYGFDRGWESLGGLSLAAEMAKKKLAKLPNANSAILRGANARAAEKPLAAAAASFEQDLRYVARDVLGAPSSLPELMAFLCAHGQEPALAARLELLRDYARGAFVRDQRRALDKLPVGFLDVCLPDGDRDRFLVDFVKRVLQPSGKFYRSFHPDAIEIVWHAVNLDFLDSHLYQRSVENQDVLPADTKFYWTTMDSSEEPQHVD